MVGTSESEKSTAVSSTKFWIDGETVKGPRGMKIQIQWERPHWRRWLRFWQQWPSVLTPQIGQTYSPDHCQWMATSCKDTANSWESILSAGSRSEEKGKRRRAFSAPANMACRMPACAEGCMVSVGPVEEETVRPHPYCNSLQPGRIRLLETWVNNYPERCWCILFYFIF